MILLQQMLVLFFYMLIGYFFAKRDIFDSHFCSGISWLVTNVANPALVISAVVNGDGTIRGEELLLVTGIAVVTYVVLLVMAALIPKVLRISAKDDICVYRNMTVFSNIGFMGFPLISATYGQGALLYAVVFQLVFFLLLYTYGVQNMKGGGKMEWKRFLNAGVICGILAVILYLTDLEVPEIIKTASDGLGSLCGPLSMIVIGISLAQIPLRSLVTDLKMDLFALVKLLVVPVIGILLIRLVTDNAILLGVCLVMLGTPAGSITAMMAQQYHRGVETASRGVALTTILSVITIPLLSLLLL